MKKDKIIAVRLEEPEYERFLATTGRHYSKTLREMVQIYLRNYKPEDSKTRVKERVKLIMSR